MAKPVTFTTRAGERIAKAVRKVEAIDLRRPKKLRPAVPSRGTSTIYLQILAEATMKGMYTAEIGTRNDTEIDHTAATYLDLDALHTWATTVVFANQEEEGLNLDHILVAGDIVEAVLWGATADGTALYRGHPARVPGC